MPDPFEHMRLPETPVDPDPIFATRLRAQIARVIQQPGGASMTTQLRSRPAVLVTGATIHPYLAVSGAEAAIEWYAEAFGARVASDPIVMPDGRIGHAELDIGGALVMLSEENPSIGVEAPSDDRGVPVTIYLSVGDVDVVFERAVGSGATVDRAVADYPYGRNGVIKDPFGHRWMISGPTPVSAPRKGDLGYVSLWVPDVDRAAAFFAHVLGWEYGPASGPGGRRVEGRSLHHGLWGASAHTLFCCYAVDSVAEALERVRSAGGTAAEPMTEPYGFVAECRDDQGVPFAVFEPPGGTGREPSHPNGAHHGDLAYVTMEVPDSARTRAFYGAVLGWRFAPGRVLDGWTVEDVSPMVGISGGHEVATAVPQYRVDDIAEAVAAVREAGGTATDPEQRPYGITAECVDDQGTRFGLGQF